MLKSSKLINSSFLCNLRRRLTTPSLVRAPLQERIVGYSWCRLIPLKMSAGPVEGPHDFGLPAEATLGRTMLRILCVLALGSRLQPSTSSHRDGDGNAETYQNHSTKFTAVLTS